MDQASSCARSDCIELDRSEQPEDLQLDIGERQTLLRFKTSMQQTQKELQRDS